VLNVPSSIKKLAAGLVLSAAGLVFVQGWEGTQEVAYLDIAGVPTICTGSTRGVRIGQVAKEGECLYRLREDTSRAGKAVQRCTTAPVTQEQYDALLSLTFNIGEGAYCKSTLVRKLNAGDCYGAYTEFLRWDYAWGKRSKGLGNRRKAESELFRTGCV